MLDRLSLSVLDGPQVGETIQVTGSRASLGGKGSNADIELSGLPDGIKFIDLVGAGKSWTLVEFEARTVLLNERELKRRNRLSEGDTIWLPSFVSGQSVRLVAHFEAPPKASAASESLGKMNPKVMALLAVYLVLFLAAGLFFAMNDGGDGGGAPITAADVRAALEVDIAALDGDAALPGTTVPLGEEPFDFADLAMFLNTGLPEDRKTELSDRFASRVTEMFAEAWRLEKQSRWDEARALYRKVVDLMVKGPAESQTTQLALRQYARIEGR